MIYLEPFKFFCQSVLPASVDDSLSYYQVLCKMVNKLNEVISNSNSQNEAIENLIKYVNEHVTTEALAKAFEQYVKDNPEVVTFVADDSLTLPKFTTELTTQTLNEYVNIKPLLETEPFGDVVTAQNAKSPLYLANTTTEIITITPPSTNAMIFQNVSFEPADNSNFIDASNLYFDNCTFTKLFKIVNSTNHTSNNIIFNNCHFADGFNGVGNFTNIKFIDCHFEKHVNRSALQITGICDNLLIDTCTFVKSDTNAVNAQQSSCVNLVNIKNSLILNSSFTITSSNFAGAVCVITAGTTENSEPISTNNVVENCIFNGYTGCVLSNLLNTQIINCTQNGGVRLCQYIGLDYADEVTKLIGCNSTVELVINQNGLGSLYLFDCVSGKLLYRRNATNTETLKVRSCKGIPLIQPAQFNERYDFELQWVRINPGTFIYVPHNTLLFKATGTPPTDLNGNALTIDPKKAFNNFYVACPSSAGVYSDLKYVLNDDVPNTTNPDITFNLREDEELKYVIENGVDMTKK